MFVGRIVRYTPVYVVWTTSADLVGVPRFTIVENYMYPRGACNDQADHSSFSSYQNHCSTEETSTHEPVDWPTTEQSIESDRVTTSQAFHLPYMHSPQSTRTPHGGDSILYRRFVPFTMSPIPAPPNPRTRLLSRMPCSHLRK